MDINTQNLIKKERIVNQINCNSNLDKINFTILQQVFNIMNSISMIYFIIKCQKIGNLIIKFCLRDILTKARQFNINNSFQMLYKYGLGLKTESSFELVNYSNKVVRIILIYSIVLISSLT